MSSPSASDSLAPPSGRKPLRFLKRGVPNNGTFILPGTGERVRRQITLRNSSNFEPPSNHDSNEYTIGVPLRRTFSQAGTFKTAVAGCKSLLNKAYEYSKKPEAKGILKCSLAYLLGSMGTFFPPFANFLGAQDGKHVVATITVYFHPSRSLGSMQEAAILGIAAFCYATFIGVSSMATSVFFETWLGWIELGHAIVLVVFCGGGLGFIGWFKQMYNSPLVGVACSLASLAIITVLTKETAVIVGVFSDDKIVQVMKMVLMGISATSLISLLVWPISARSELRENMIKATDSFSKMLTMITHAFLSGSEAEMGSKEFQKQSNQYRVVFDKLAKNLKEAKLEHFVVGTEKQYLLEKKVVKCMQKLAQSIGGLRSAATTQFSLLRETTAGGGGTTPVRRLKQSPFDYNSLPSGSHQEHFAALAAIQEASEEGSESDSQQDPNMPQLRRIDTDTIITSPSSWAMTANPTGEIFSRFIMHLGPSMKSLAYTISEILKELPFGPAPDYPIAINEHFQPSLSDALNMYHSHRSEALKVLYKSKELHKDQSETIEADFEEVAASCGHFSFSLYHFGTEMQDFLEALEDLKAHIHDSEKGRSWKWLRIWENWMQSTKSITDTEREPLLSQCENPAVKDSAGSSNERLNPKLRNIPIEERRITNGLFRRIFHALRVIERDDVRFALKVGIGATLYALFAFIPETRPFYRHWRGEWGLVSYMLVCSMTIGASNSTGWSRFFGTLLGAMLAVVMWTLCQGNPFALAFSGWLVSLPCFYIIIAKNNGPFGRFIMLTYNVSCLYAYSISIKETDDDDDEGGATPFIFDIAVHRVAAVLAGCIWGLIVTRLIFPISARKKFTDGLSLLWLRMGLVWKRDPLKSLLEGEHKHSYMNIGEEFTFQKYVLQLNNLRGSAANEFELRGPFPSRQYKRIMESTSRMLEAFHAMNVVLQQDKDVYANEGETLLLQNTAKEREDLCLRISHLFQVLASSIKLEYPLTDGLPNTINARDKLLAKIFKYRKTKGNNMNTIAKDEDYEILYAFTLVTRQLSEEIEKVEKDIVELFGVPDEEMLRLQ